jgi:hypothetical protein
MKPSLEKDCFAAKLIVHSCFYIIKEKGSLIRRLSDLIAIFKKKNTLMFWVP